jgi:valyl-tRNA synthetase
MSKSKGNTVDPLGLIDQYGADALRFTLAAMESQGRDIKLDEKRVEGYRNFATKLWNAARFLQGNGVGASASVAAPTATLAVNKWIIGEVVETLAKLDQAIADLRYDAMADAIYHFAWGTFCDWYIELVKGAFDDETRTVAGWAFDQILVMLHPFMPFITEELWGSMGARGGNLLIHAKWPAPGAVVDAEAKAEIEWLTGFVQSLRSGRTDMNILPSLKTDLIVHNDNKLVGFEVVGGPRFDLVERFKALGPALARLARIDVVEFALSGTAFNLSDGTVINRLAYESGKTAVFQVVYDDTTYSVPLAGVIDTDAERARLTKGIEAATKEADSVGKRLDNPAFVEKAKPEAIAKARADHAEKTAEAERLRAALARLG